MSSRLWLVNFSFYTTCRCIEDLRDIFPPFRGVFIGLLIDTGPSFQVSKSPSLDDLGTLENQIFMIPKQLTCQGEKCRPYWSGWQGIHVHKTGTYLIRISFRVSRYVLASGISWVLVWMVYLIRCASENKSALQRRKKGLNCNSQNSYAHIFVIACIVCTHVVIRQKHSLLSCHFHDLCVLSYCSRIIWINCDLLFPENINCCLKLLFHFQKYILQHFFGTHKKIKNNQITEYLRSMCT